MKSKIITFILIIFPVFCFSQRIYIDEMKSDSIRYVESECVYYRKFTDTHIWNYGIQSYTNINTNQTQFLLAININSSYKLHFKDDAKMLIKTFNNEILELTNMLSYFDKTTLGYTYKNPLIGDIGTIHENIIAKNIAIFYITEDDIVKLKNGISKVRVELKNSNYLDYTYKKDRIGEKLYNSYINIKQTLSSSPNNDSQLYNNF